MEQENESLLIVNDQNEVIGSKPRRTVTPDDYFRVSALWINDPRNNILLARRSETRKFSPGLWDIAVVGSHAEGETYRSNIIKEAEEELGLVGLEMQERPVTLVVNNYGYKFFLQIFTTTLEPQDFTLQEDEVAETKWFNPEELVKSVETQPGIFVYEMPLWVKEMIP